MQDFKGTTVDGEVKAAETGTTRATAHLPGLDIEIMHRRAVEGHAEQISINLRAVPSFEAFGRALEAANCILGASRATRLAAVARDPGAGARTHAVVAAVERRRYVAFRAGDRLVGLAYRERGLMRYKVKSIWAVSQKAVSASCRRDCLKLLSALVAAVRHPAAPSAL
jgi:hypothetical protein